MRSVVRCRDGGGIAPIGAGQRRVNETPSVGVSGAQRGPFGPFFPGEHMVGGEQPLCRIAHDLLLLIDSIAPTNCLVEAGN